MENTKYYVGLDIGTNSVGFAVTDEKYNLIRAKGQNFWGVRMFDEATNAQERRVKRSNRRRLTRRGLKLLWLRELFEKEISAVDCEFFSRLKYSNLWLEDKMLLNKNLSSKNSLFDDKTSTLFDDKAFFKKYPTIYHLRASVIEKPAEDIRFLYLAIHNIIKRRGHFLTEVELTESGSITNLINNLSNFIPEVLENMGGFVYFTQEKEQELLKSIKEIKGIRDLKTKFNEIFETNKNKKLKSIVDIFVSGNFKLKDIFDGVEDKTTYSFDNENYESEVLPILEQTLTSEELILMDKIKSIYSAIQIQNILDGKDYICQSMIVKYNKHKQDLKEFKAFIRKYYKSQYFRLFKQYKEGKKENKEVNYAFYVNNDKFNNKKHILTLSSSVKRTQEEFFKLVKKILASEPEIQEEMEEYEAKKSLILFKIETNDFLPKLRSKINSILPNKLYEKELKKILEVNSTKFEFLNKKDESGLTVAEKILEILRFRIPYFVGPVGKSEDFGWAKRNKTIDYKPWNFEKMIDFDKAEEGFIQRMINKCVYLKDKDVIAKNSLLYSKFKVLNEINNLKINGEKISVDLKQKLFNNLFKIEKKVTLNKIKNFLVNEGLFDKNQIKDVVISGVDKTTDLANNYAPYIQFSAILGQEFVDKNISLIEEIIMFITIISDKSRLEKRLKKNFGDVLSEKQIKLIKGLNFSDWGRMSKEFLENPVIDKTTGERTSIINLMWETNQNLQEIIFNTNYNINEILDEYALNNQKDLNYELVKKSYCSPAVKRSVWQTLKILNEIFETMEAKPDKIFVEVTRDNEDKQNRKDSRKDNLLKLYQSKEFKNYVKNISVDLDKLMKELNAQENSTLRSERIYLYFLQLGKCAYSGEAINLNYITMENQYDVDHIIPRAMRKDDSLDNKVLVKNQYNKAKGEAYPIYKKFPEWVENQKSFWEYLVKMGLMSSSKYNRLVRKTEISNEEEGDFIARQLVETNQSAKAVIDILKNIMENPRDIVYSKARFVSDFRNRNKIYKSREVNDLHHAKDAYLNVVVGNVLFNRFTDDPRHFYIKDKNNKDKTHKIDCLFYKTIKSFKNDEIIWHGKEDIERVKKICFYNDCLVSKMSFCNLNGAYYDETIYKKGDNPAYIPLKNAENNPLKNPLKYGGYKSAKTAYFMLIESEDKKGNKIKTIEALPIMVYQKYKNEVNKQEKFLEYIAEKSGLSNPKVLMEKINIQSTLKIGKGYYLLAGKTGAHLILHNFNQWFVSNDTSKYAKAIEKFVKLKTENIFKKFEEVDGKVVIAEASKKNNTEIALIHEENIKLYEELISQLKKNIYSNTPIATISEFLNNHIEAFKELSVLDQVELLIGVMKRVKTGASAADLSKLGGKSGVGKFLINKNITDKNIQLVISSSTGLKRKYIKL